jgi:SAM-dependent methyltransferase
VADAVVTKLSFDSGASAWDRFSTRFSALNVPALLAAADIKEGECVLDVATGTGPSAVEAAAIVGQGGLVLGTDISFPMMRKAKPNVEHLPVSRREAGFRRVPTRASPGGLHGGERNDHSGAKRVRESLRSSSALSPCRARCHGLELCAQ